LKVSVACCRLGGWHCRVGVVEVVEEEEEEGVKEILMDGEGVEEEEVMVEMSKEGVVRVGVEEEEVW